MGKKNKAGKKKSHHKTKAENAASYGPPKNVAVLPAMPVNPNLPPHPGGTDAIVLAILSIFNPVLAPIALILAIAKRGQIKKGEYAPTGTVTAAVVVSGVITAVLAVVFVAIVYVVSDLNEKAKWSEGKTAAGTIRQALDVYKAKNSGNVTAHHPPANYKVRTLADVLRLDVGQFSSMNHFHADDFTITLKADNSYIITVKGSKSDSPSGTYRLDSAGREEIP